MIMNMPKAKLVSTFKLTRGIVPPVPNPPTVTRITSDTIELSWEPPLFSSSGKCYDYLIYVIEEKECIHTTQEYSIVYG